MSSASGTSLAKEPSGLALLGCPAHILSSLPLPSIQKGPSWCHTPTPGVPRWLVATPLGGYDSLTSHGVLQQRPTGVAVSSPTWLHNSFGFITALAS
jgi:hypothetical protein